MTTLASSEEAARTELTVCSVEQHASLQAVTTDLLHNVDMTDSAVSAFSLRVNDFCDNMQEVSKVAKVV